ncbi:MAG: hypothetical protein CMK09_18925 [Ponticaulis sp.]|nr:hypothetical protein [Ponticaulis sp.]|tara:strand:- start:156863 stop:158155 length:1293 start_codon:yes stop_codon:yes gene_type:complete
MRLVVKAIAASLLGLALSGSFAASAQNACLKGEALETAFRAARSDVDQRVKEMEFSDAMAPLRAYAIHYWMDRNAKGATDSLTRFALSQCWSGLCGNPPRGRLSDGTPTRFQSLLSYGYQLSQYEGGHRDTPPEPPSAFPPGEMLVWADEQLECDWSLPGIQQAPVTPVAATPAKPQQACLKGRELTNTMINSINAIPGKSDETKAYLILYWKRAGYQIYDDPYLLSLISACTYPKGNCGLPEDYSNTRFQKLLDFNDELIAYKNGRTSVEPLGPLDAPFPDDSMVDWAEGVLACDATDYVQVSVDPVADDPQWVGYDAARAAGGDRFYQWWRRNMEMRSGADARELCRKFGSASYECGLVAEWTYLNTGTNPYTGGTQQTYQGGVYSDSGNNPYNAGYNGPTRSNTYTPPSNEPRCYDQGDGTEKCFYD